MVSVKRIVTDVKADDLELATLFYQDILQMELVMDQGWIRTYASPSETRPQISIASEGGSGAPVPDISIEVDNIDEVFAAVNEAKLKVTYALTEEPWGVKRFFVVDPFGKTVNVLQHTGND